MHNSPVLNMTMPRQFRKSHNITTASDSNDDGLILEHAGMMAAHDEASRSEVTEENGGMVVPELDETQKRLVVESLNKIHDKYLQQRNDLMNNPHDSQKLEKLLHKLSYMQNIILGKKGVYDYLLRGRGWSYATQEEEPYSGQATDFPKLIDHLISHIKPEEYEIINLREIFDESLQVILQEMRENNNLSFEDIHHYAQAASFLGALDVSVGIEQAIKQAYVEVSAHEGYGAVPENDNDDIVKTARAAEIHDPVVVIEHMDMPKLALTAQQYDIVMDSLKKIEDFSLKVISLDPDRSVADQLKISDLYFCVKNVCGAQGLPACFYNGKDLNSVVKYLIGVLQAEQASVINLVEIFNLSSQVIHRTLLDAPDDLLLQDRHAYEQAAEFMRQLALSISNAQQLITPLSADPQDSLDSIATFMDPSLIAASNKEQEITVLGSERAVPLSEGELTKEQFSIIIDSLNESEHSFKELISLSSQLADNNLTTPAKSGKLAQTQQLAELILCKNIICGEKGLLAYFYEGKNLNEVIEDVLGILQAEEIEVVNLVDIFDVASQVIKRKLDGSTELSSIKDDYAKAAEFVDKLSCIAKAAQQLITPFPNNASDDPLPIVDIANIGHGSVARVQDLLSQNCTNSAVMAASKDKQTAQAARGATIVMLQKLTKEEGDIVLSCLSYISRKHKQDIVSLTFDIQLLDSSASINFYPDENKVVKARAQLEKETMKKEFGDLVIKQFEEYLKQEDPSTAFTVLIDELTRHIIKNKLDIDWIMPVLTEIKRHIYLEVLTSGTNKWPAVNFMNLLCSELQLNVRFQALQDKNSNHYDTTQKERIDKALVVAAGMMDKRPSNLGDKKVSKHFAQSLIKYFSEQGTFIAADIDYLLDLCNGVVNSNTYKDTSFWQGITQEFNNLSVAEFKVCFKDGQESVLGSILTSEDTNGNSAIKDGQFLYHVSRLSGASQQHLVHTLSGIRELLSAKIDSLSKSINDLSASPSLAESRKDLLIAERALGDVKRLQDLQANLISAKFTLSKNKLDALSELSEYIKQCGILRDNHQGHCAQEINKFINEFLHHRSDARNAKHNDLDDLLSQFRRLCGRVGCDKVTACLDTILNDDNTMSEQGKKELRELSGMMQGFAESKSPLAKFWSEINNSFESLALTAAAVTGTATCVGYVFGVLSIPLASVVAASAILSLASVVGAVKYNDLDRFCGIDATLNKIRAVSAASLPDTASLSPTLS